MIGVDTLILVDPIYILNFGEIISSLVLLFPFISG